MTERYSEMPQQPERDEAVIRVQGLVNRFGDNVVHEGLDLTLYRGEILGVVGGSGTGKSVLLRSIVGLKRPNDGTVEVLNQRLNELSESQRRPVERRFGVQVQDADISLGNCNTLRGLSELVQRRRSA